MSCLKYTEYRTVDTSTQIILGVCFLVAFQVRVVKVKDLALVLSFSKIVQGKNYPNF